MSHPSRADLIHRGYSLSQSVWSNSRRDFLTILSKRTDLSLSPHRTLHGEEQPALIHRAVFFHDELIATASLRGYHNLSDNIWWVSSNIPPVLFWTKELETEDPLLNSKEF